MECARDSAVQYSIETFEGNVVIHGEVFGHKSLLADIHFQASVRFVEHQVAGLLLVGVIVEHHNFNSILQNIVAALHGLVPFAVAGHHLYKLPVFSFFTHDLHPVPLVLFCLVNQLGVIVL